jgi:Oxidoreductase family, NAD-binding Rossmann fold
MSDVLCSSIGFAAILLSGSALFGADIRLGIVSTDTSHVIHFTRILNEDRDPEHVPGARVVAAYKGGSPDIPSSRNRVDGFEQELIKTYHVEIVPDIPTLCSKVDGLLLESGDGRVHLAQARQVIAAGKPLFIDPPLASTLEEAREIARLAKQAGVPWFSSSTVRFDEIATAGKYADARGADVWGPGPMEEHHYLDLSWYANHPIELLFTLMGTGCEQVTRAAGGDFASGSDVIVGRWKDGRIGTVRTLRPYGQWGGVVIRPKQIVSVHPATTLSYGPIVRQIVAFFQTGKPPAPNEETLEMYGFMDAAQRSKAADGQPMSLR